MTLTASRQRIKYILTDYVTTNLALLTFNVFRYYAIAGGDMGFHTLRSYLGSAVVMAEQAIVPQLFMFIYWLSGYYNSPFRKSQLQEFLTTLATAALNAIIIMLAFLTNDMTAEQAFNYRLLAMAFLVLFAFPYAGRLWITKSAQRMVARGRLTFPSVIIGASAKALETVKAFQRGRIPSGFEVVGYVPLEGEQTAVAEPKKLVTLDSVQQLAKEGKINQIIIVPETTDEGRVVELLNSLYPLGVPVKIAPDEMSYLTSGIRLQDIYSEPLVELNSPRMMEASKNIKRTLDVVASALALAVLALPMAVIAVLVKRGSSGPVIYSQERVGYRRKPFKIYKFRSMYTDAEACGPQLSNENDSRITPLGQILRKYRLDELPQFWNVLKGDMSLVGPRPEREHFIRLITRRAPWYPLLLQVRPGITSWGIVKKGYCSDVEQMTQRSKYDLVYIANMSLIVDLKILIYTVQTVVMGKGL